MTNEQETLRRVQEAGYLLQKALAAEVARHMEARFGMSWTSRAIRARGGEADVSLDLYSLLKTIISNWNEVFQPVLPANARTFAYVALEGRNKAAHPGDPISREAAIRYLDAHHELMKAVKSSRASDVYRLWREEVMASSSTGDRLTTLAAARSAAPPSTSIRQAANLGAAESNERAAKAEGLSHHGPHAFWVYENWTHEHVRVHRASCPYCNEGRGIHKSDSGHNGKWHGPFIA